MDWLNLHISVLDSPECLRCDPVRRATWVWLLRYCIGQENGGVIRSCRSWGDTTWQQMCRVRLKEVNSESPLWEWVGDDLQVSFYPIEKQAEVQAKRDAGQRGGRPRLKQLNNHVVNHMVNHQVKRAETEGKGREEERKGREGNARADSELDICSPSTATPGPVSDADRWRMSEMNEPWARSLKSALCKIGRDNWRQWFAIVEDHGIVAVVQAAKDIPATERWPDRVESALVASRGQVNPGVAVSRKTIKVTL